MLTVFHLRTGLHQITQNGIGINPGIFDMDIMEKVFKAVIQKLQ